MEIYEEVYQYLTNGFYTASATKTEKAVVRRRAKNFQVIDGVLYYIGSNGDLKKQVRNIYAAFWNMLAK